MARLNVTRLIEAQSFSDAAKPIKPVSREFLERLAVDPSVQDWLISVSDVEHTRVTYLDYFGRFINWTG